MAETHLSNEQTGTTIWLEGNRELASEIVERVLKDVYDPEMPMVNLVELGMIDGVSVTDHHVRVRLMPTFVGCPALTLIQDRVRSAVMAYNSAYQVDIELVFDPPWSTDRVHDTAKEKLKSFGIASPKCSLYVQHWKAECPYCGSSDTKVENLFGPTACRSVWYCCTCHQPFEAMKPL